MPTSDEVITKYTLDPTGYTRGANQVKASTKSTGAALEGFTHIATRLGMALTTAASAAGVGMLGLAGVAMNAAANFEAMKLGLISITGSAALAEEQLKRLQEVARLPGLGFQEAVLGSTRLQAAGLDARLAERALLGFGNALALVGKGKDDLDGVILALTQIASKGSVSAEEINQIAERVPQIRKLMQAAFGTADTEMLAKQGVKPQEFITKMIDALGTLPKATGGAKNAFENFGDAMNRAFVSVGQVLNDTLMPAFSKISDFIGYLADSGVITSLMNSLVGPLGGAGGFGDMVIKGISYAISIIKRLPEVFGIAMESIKAKIDSVITAMKPVFEWIKSAIESYNSFAEGKIGKMLGLRSMSQLYDLSVSMNPLALDSGALGKIGDVMSSAGAEAEAIAGGFANFKPSNKTEGDMSKGGFTSSGGGVFQSIERNTRATAENTKPFTERTGIVGGGDIARMGIPISERSKRHTGRSKEADQIADLIDAMVKRLSMQTLNVLDYPSYGSR